MIITCVLLNALVLAGIFIPDKLPKRIAVIDQTPLVAVVAPPTLNLTATPSSTNAGGYSALSWTTTGNVTGCTASGNWTGPKTAFGSESTGRIPAAGNYTYTLECLNAGGSIKADAVLTVGNAIAPPKAAAVVKSTGGTVYCGGRLPCYGPSQVAAHASSSNCWGYNLDRVIDLSGFDAGFHVVKSGISSISIGSICGKNLASALSGQTSAEGQTRNHNATTKQNADKNMIPYFIGYLDATKP
jgi:hypothetical protein